MISTFQINQWTPQTLIESHNQLHDALLAQNGMEQMQPAMYLPNPVKFQKHSGDKLCVKKSPQKAPMKIAKENTGTINGVEKIDDEQVAWKLHLDLNTKPRPGKSRPVRQKLTRTLSLPGTDKIPESHSRRKQSRKNIRRSL